MQNESQTNIVISYISDITNNPGVILGQPDVRLTMLDYWPQNCKLTNLTGL